jgi:hypothetical protein
MKLPVPSFYNSQCKKYTTLLHAVVENALALAVNIWNI